MNLKIKGRFYLLAVFFYILDNAYLVDFYWIMINTFCIQLKYFVNYKNKALLSMID